MLICYGKSTVVSSALSQVMCQFPWSILSPGDSGPGTAESRLTCPRNWHPGLPFKKAACPPDKSNFLKLDDPLEQFQKMAEIFS